MPTVEKFHDRYLNFGKTGIGRWVGVLADVELVRIPSNPIGYLGD